MLDLRLSLVPGHVSVSTDESSSGDLQLLRSRYATSLAVSSASFDVSITEFITDLQPLTTWTSKIGWEWQPELRELIEGNAEDVAVLDAGLAGDQSSVELVDLPSEWNGRLTWFQHRDLSKLLALRNGANFSVPGAGKTRVGLASFLFRRGRGEVEQLLVVAPKSAFESWLAEAEEAPERPSVEIATAQPLPSADIVLINYERLPQLENALIRLLRDRPSMLLLDEAHRTKLGAEGAWGSACLAMAPFAVRRLILTGTPAPNGARDLENLFAFVWPGQGAVRVGHALAGADLGHASRILKPLFARTTKAELGLPKANLQKRHVPLTKLHRDLYDALIGQASNDVASNPGDVRALGRILMYLLMAATTPALLAVGSSPYEPLPYRVPPLDPPDGSSMAELMEDLPLYELSPKYQEALKMVGDNASVNRKTLVWSTFVRNLTSLERLMSEYQPAMIHGATDAADREAELRRFREDPDCYVLLTNPATLGEGVSLHHWCHDAVYIDRDFAAGRFMQSVDRIHRLGLAQDVETNVTVLIATETVDELVASRLDMKVNFMGKILDDEAVLKLADLDEEPTESVGMSPADVEALTRFISDRAG